MRRTVIGFLFSLHCFAGTTSRLYTMAFLEIELPLGERSVVGTCRSICLAPAKMLNCFWTKLKGQKHLSLK